MSSDLTPALTRAEWAGVLANRDHLVSLRERSDLPFSGHALAALFLYDEPFGFTQQDVDDERQVAEYCAMMVTQHEAAGKSDTAETFRLLGTRHSDRADRIAALLPPAD